jgi:hypothetical protein
MPDELEPHWHPAIVQSVAVTLSLFKLFKNASELERATALTGDTLALARASLWGRRRAQASI